MIGDLFGGVTLLYGRIRSRRITRSHRWRAAVVFAGPGQHLRSAERCISWNVNSDIASRTLFARPAGVAIRANEIR